MTNGNEGNEFPPGEGGTPQTGHDADMPLNTGRPAVAAAPGKLIFVILFAGIFIFIIVRSLFFGEKPQVKEVVRHKETVTSAQGKGGEGGEISISPEALPAPLNDLTTATTTPPPPLPPPPPALINPPNPELLQHGAPTNEALSKRIHSGMFIVGGNGGGKAGTTEARRRAALEAGNDPNSAFAQSIAGSQAEKAEATVVRNLTNTIVQGKFVQAVLETAISSDLPGTIRAIVSHDIYAEAGRGIMIPKGSRLVGTYNSQIARGQGRVLIIWQRLIRPDGVDLEIASPGIDSLGRGGMAGDVDNKYFEMFSTSIMTSALSIGVAAAGDALFGNQQQTTTSGGGGTTTTSSPTATAMQQAVANVGQVGNNIVNGVLGTKPTITIDQGSPINVFVNRDLIFPAEFSGVNIE